ncbi:MAG: hypothetical protein M0R17_03050 [Candidatus Omnitrophica bacterium]|nr:hypothetical protein [Candidatus Omnitrophota bacterium]
MQQHITSDQVVEPQYHNTSLVEETKQHFIPLTDIIYLKRLLKLAYIYNFSFEYCTDIIKHTKINLRSDIQEPSWKLYIITESKDGFYYMGRKLNILQSTLMNNTFIRSIRIISRSEVLRLKGLKRISSHEIELFGHDIDIFRPILDCDIKEEVIINSSGLFYKPIIEHQVLSNDTTNKLFKLYHDLIPF